MQNWPLLLKKNYFQQENKIIKNIEENMMKITLE